MGDFWSSNTSVSETVRAAIIFLAAPALWWTAVLFIRVEPGERRRVATNYLRTPVGMMYILLPAALLPAAILWWIAGSMRNGGPAATPFAPFWLATYVAAAAVYWFQRWRRLR